ncbi:phosphate ABC transporter substrate-binding protein [Psychromonas sp. MB-3u-54]|uniref:phosphate ABC transporter substrate-binding protein n=1 Tax=Psychromonas sp. MB-3u-54 TaxID=2058319 RepID=UPI0012FF0E14|nr:phosphate ABC transporter substrate-binding protein [Psychromonas sp. MB-3u-54]
MKKVIGLLAAIVLSPLSFASSETTVTIAGSTSVSHVLEVLGETYQKKTGIDVEVQGMGSSAGIVAVKNGITMLGMSSRELAIDELTDMNTTVIAHDGIAIVINKSNPVDNLSREEIKKIYRQEITNWKEVGGEDKPIIAVTRDVSSGTREEFEKILGLKRIVNNIEVSDISQRTLVGNGNGMVKTLVANNIYALAYISLGSVDNELLVKALSVDGIEATNEHIFSGDYKLARPFIVLYKKNVAQPALDFINYIMSDEAQKIIEDQGYISIAQSHN